MFIFFYFQEVFYTLKITLLIKLLNLPTLQSTYVNKISDNLILYEPCNKSKYFISDKSNDIIIITT